MNNLDNLVSLCKRRGFIFQGSEVYGGLAGTWDFGPLGVALKRKIKDLWWQYWVESRDDMFGVDAAILMNPKVWEASGHTKTFSDPLVECKDCHSRFRADSLGDGMNEHVSTEAFLAKNIKCPNCGKFNWSDVRQFNEMFVTFVGPTHDDSARTYLRPETAQGIFTNYKNVVDTFYPNLPFGLAQQGKAFRNEISPRDFIFRTREFEQMEIEYFVNPNSWEEDFDKISYEAHNFLAEAMHLPVDKIHDYEVPAEDRAHYSKRTVDVMYDYYIGQEELMGIAYRTDFDLKNIQKATNKSMEYRDKNTGETFIPHVIEPSFGVERLLMAVLESAYTEDEIGGSKRTLLKLPTDLAPYRFCVSPLLRNKPELVEKAKSVYDALKVKYGNITWDDSGNIGKRYRKQDEIGTPECIVIDFQTLEDDTVTVRNRDDASQKRVSIEKL